MFVVWDVVELMGIGYEEVNFGKNVCVSLFLISVSIEECKLLIFVLSLLERLIWFVKILEVLVRIIFKCWRCYRYI